MHFIYVKVPFVDDNAEFVHRRIEAALDQQLQERRLGAVLGWGASLGEPGRDGKRPLAFHRIDIEVVAVDPARRHLREALSALAAPPGTEMHYRADAAPARDLLTPQGWTLGGTGAQAGTAGADAPGA